MVAEKQIALHNGRVIVPRRETAMKALAKITVIALVVALALPLTAFAEEGAIPLPLTKKIPAGITTLDYAGQQLRFSSPVPLALKFEPLDKIRIRLTVKVYQIPGGGGASGSSSSANYVDIYWENYGTVIYNGSLSEPFEGILHAESGFTEK